MLTGNKDTDVIILSKLSCLDIKNILVLSKFYSKYHNNILWRNYSERYWKTDFEIMKTVINRSWKEFAILLQKCLDGACGYRDAMYRAAESGYRDLVDFFISKGATNWNWAMDYAAQGGHRDLVDFFISKGADGWDGGLYFAAEGGHRDLVDFFIEKGSNNWTGGMYAASRGNHRELVEYFISKSANNWEYAMEGAKLFGHSDLVDFFQEKIDLNSKKTK